MALEAEEKNGILPESLLELKEKKETLEDEERELDHLHRKNEAAEKKLTVLLQKREELTEKYGMVGRLDRIANGKRRQAPAWIFRPMCSVGISTPSSRRRTGGWSS